MVPDPQLLAGGVDALARIEIGRVDAQVDVGHERAQQDHAVALFDELGDLFAAHRPFVQADEQRMRFGDDAFAEHRGGDGNLRALGQRQQLVLQAEAMDLHAAR